jgi:hypothetical protein
MVPKGGLPALLLGFLVVAVTLPSVFVNVARSRTDSDVERIQRQLARVERQLLAHGGDSSPAQALARGEQIARLHEYRVRGVFPHNHDFPGKVVPYFVDRHGTLCAMAYLIDASGGGDIVRAVSTARNNATVMELAADPTLGPALADWLDHAGLTVQEAQSIQPAYGGYWEGSWRDRNEVTPAYAIGSGLVGAVNVLSIGVNGATAESGKGPRWAAALGMTAGAAGMALGIANWDRDGTRGNIAVANTTLGALSFLLSTFALAREPKPAPVWVQADSPRLSLSPELRVNAAGPMVGVRASF